MTVACARRAALVAALGVGVTAAPAGAAVAPRVEVMVAGKTRVLRAPVTVRAAAFTLALGPRRCAVAAGTPLAALEAARRGARGPGYRVLDFGSCSDRPGDAASLYVSRIGPDLRGGPNGWVYKIGRRTPGIGAADLGARVRSGSRVTWFYCRTQRTGGCQRTLELAVVPALAPSGDVLVRVRGYDDNGRGVPVAGATVRAAGQASISDSAGLARITPPGPGRYRVSADKSGTVAAFGLLVGAA